MQRGGHPRKLQPLESLISNFQPSTICFRIKPQLDPVFTKTPNPDHVARYIHTNIMFYFRLRVVKGYNRNLIISGRKTVLKPIYLTIAVLSEFFWSATTAVQWATSHIHVYYIVMHKRRYRTQRKVS